MISPLIELSGTINPMTQDHDQQAFSHGARDLTAGSIPRHVIAFSLPMLAGSAIQTAYSFVNAVWVGQYLGTEALAALTVSMPVIFVSIAVAAGFTIAANVLVSQSFGARDFDSLHATVRTSTALVNLAGLLLLALGLTLAGPLLRLMHTPADIFTASLSYLRIILWTLPLTFAVFLIASLLRGIGDSKTPVYFQVVSLLLNAALDPVLMFGLGPFPKLGLNGTAWASLFSQAAAVVAMLLYIPRQRPVVMPSWPPRPDAPTAWLLLKIGFPAMIQHSVISVSMLVIVSLVSRFGTNADAAFDAGLRIDDVAFLPALTFGMAASSLAGQNIGAGYYHRVREIFWWAVIFSGGISALIGVFAVLYPDIMLRAFLKESEVISVGVTYLRIVGFTYVLFAIMFVSNGIINGSGHTLPTTIFSMATLWGIRLPLAALLPRYVGGVEGIWYAMLISVFCGMTLSLTYLASGRWRRPIRHLQAPLGNDSEL
jgi:putative MATE family efflux protein